MSGAKFTPMQEPVITRYEALKAIDTGHPFKLTFVMADRHRGTGGELREVVNWVKVKQELEEIQLPGRTLTGQEKSNVRRANGIRLFNIYNPLDPKQHITAVHYHLMLFLNDKRIID
jgi:hypothetical protein